MDHREVYFVLSDGAQPQSVRFSREEAFKQTLYEFVDSFDENGKKIASYELRNGRFEKDAA